MFKNIFIRFLKLTILTFLLLLMFALTFYMTFRQFHSLFVNSPFSNVGHSVLKTVAMSVGDLGYDELFRQPSGGSADVVPSIPFPEISYILWIIFIILIPILFSNLLVCKVKSTETQRERENVLDLLHIVLRNTYIVLNAYDDLLLA